MTFDVWTIDEPEFMEDTERKFDILLDPIHMAMGTGGKNDHLARQAIDVLAVWALRKLFVACIKVSWWIVWTIVKRTFERQPENG